MIIKDMLGSDTLDTLTSNFDPTTIMSKLESVTQATKELVKTVKSLELYPDHQAVIERFEVLREKYPEIHSHRTVYTWKMSQAGFQLMTLKLSDADFLKSNSLKCRASFVCVTFDDICDLGRDKTVFDNCVLALKGQVNQDRVELYQLIADTWGAVENEIQQAPNYALLKPMMDKANQQWVASFEYCMQLQANPRFDEKWENRLEKIADTSLLYLVGLIDLLFVPDLSEQQASAAAQVFVRTQKMVQLANWITTWPREISQQDFTSGIFTIALENGWITWDDLNHETSENIQQKIRNSPAESCLWNECERLRVESLQIVQDAHLPALDGYVESLSPIMFLFVASAGQFIKN